MAGTPTASRIVVRAGGCNPAYGRVAIVNNDTLLEPGQEVLFTTSEEDPPGDVHSLVSFHFSSVGLETAPERARIVAKFQVAKQRAASARSGRPAARGN